MAGISELDRIIRNLKATREDINILVGEVLSENAVTIEELVRVQLDEGQRSDGSSLPDYSIGSVKKFGKKPGPMTLEKTGAYKRHILFQARGTQVAFGSTDPKAGKLEKKYGRPGAPLIALTPEHRDLVIERIVKPGLKEKLIKRIK